MLSLSPASAQHRSSVRQHCISGASIASCSSTRKNIRQTCLISRTFTRKQLRRQARLQQSAAAAAAAAAAAGMDHSSSSCSKQLPLLCGLTGSIGMGKSTVSGFFSQQGIPVLCADEVVHKLYSAGGAAVGPVGAAFASSVADGAVDRAALSKCVVGNEAAMKQLEAIVHPLVEEERAKFIREHAAASSPLLLFDIPLLFETQAQRGLDAVVVVSAPADVQRQRVMARPGMTAAKLDAILARQVPDEEKRRLADYVVDTGCSMEQTQQQVTELICQLKNRQSTAAAARALGRGFEQ
ncbi:dephospho-CoA kinase-domain-containing protein [Scenedesmus sp. NREL 46B-D3]|nr:dephospho-CoA kinase-domain-containing protein [Scenedesmus sp. NREL 46B-D3]